MKLTLLVVLLTAAPAAAQSRLYTNADLARPIRMESARLSPADAAAVLLPYRFQAPPPRALEPGPWIFVMGSSPTAGPYGEFQPFAMPRRLDGTSYADPPWFQRTYIGRSFGDGRGSHVRTPAVPLPAPHPRR